MRIIICCNDSFAAYTFRLVLIKELIKKNFDVYVICGYDSFTEKLILEGIKVINVNIRKTNKNPINDFKLYLEYKKIYQRIKPNIIINYTIKPHIYSSLAARKMNIRIINFVAGVGSMFLEDNFSRKIVINLYRRASKNVWGYIFINNSDASDFKDYQITKGTNIFFVNSEGVSLEKFKYEINYNFDPINFIFVGRLVKEKGIVEYLEASKRVREKYNNVNFYISGDYYQKKNSSISPLYIKNYVDADIVKYLGFCDDMNHIYDQMHVVVLPSYREGMPMSLIEGFAKGRVGLASDVAGCNSVIDDNINGFLFNPKSVNSLTNAIIKYIELPREKKIEMSRAAYIKAKNDFDVEKIAQKIIDIIEME